MVDGHETVTKPWGPPVRNLCCPSPPELCDCGFLGEWEWRAVYGWHDQPGFRRGDRAIRHDLARGFPPRPNDEGWWVIIGWDERCPGCGDIERFDKDANLIDRFTEQAKVVVVMDAWRR